MLPRPYDGIRIIDITHVLAGPFATYQLAVLGADVIKIEPPDDPDQSRGAGSDPVANLQQMGTQYLAQNANKRAITLDLKSAEGQAILGRMATQADILVENYRPGALEALGLGYEALSALNPKLIYCSLSAFGQTGPRREQTAYDNVIQATSGLMAMTGTKEVNPVKVGAPVIDYATGTTAAYALSAALFQRSRTGVGQRIDVAMLDVAMILMSSFMSGHLHNGYDPQPRGNGHPWSPTSACFDTADGLLMLGASNHPQQERLWTALDRPDLAQRVRTSADRTEELTALAAILRTRTAAEWEEKLQAAHVPAARVRSMKAAMQDPHLQARTIWQEIADGDAGERSVRVPVAAFHFAEGGPSVERAPPRHGADTDAVLGEFGYTPEEITAFRQRRVV